MKILTGDFVELPRSIFMRVSIFGIFIFPVETSWSRYRSEIRCAFYMHLLHIPWEKIHNVFLLSESNWIKRMNHDLSKVIEGYYSDAEGITWVTQENNPHVGSLDWAEKEEVRAVAWEVHRLPWWSFGVARRDTPYKPAFCRRIGSASGIPVYAPKKPTRSSRWRFDPRESGWTEAPCKISAAKPRPRALPASARLYERSCNYLQ